MKRLLLIAVLLSWIVPQGFSQIRMTTLKLHRNETYEIQGTDILVVDTLVMGDSSRIVLDIDAGDNFIHAKKMIIGRGARIIGRGTAGAPGKTGARGAYAGGPCRDGSDAQPGMAGEAAGNAVNFFLYVDELVINGTLIVDITGGDGGQGGKGGIGGDGSAGTRLCKGGSGGAGGTGAPGGDGGNGGNFTITSPYGTELRLRIGEKIIVKLLGGFGGQGGDGGNGGQRGLGSIKDGSTGKKGANGTAGKPGKPGGIFFEKKEVK